MRRDFAKQCGLWRENDEKLVITMDANESTTDGPLRKILEKEGAELEEFSHKYYGSTSPHTFIDGKIPIDAGYTTPDMEITSFCMLSFLDSTDDHIKLKNNSCYTGLQQEWMQYTHCPGCVALSLHLG